MCLGDQLLGRPKDTQQSLNRLAALATRDMYRNGNGSLENADRLVASGGRAAAGGLIQWLSEKTRPEEVELALGLLDIRSAACAHERVVRLQRVALEPPKDHCPVSIGIGAQLGSVQATEVGSALRRRDRANEREVMRMSQSDNSVDKASFRDSIPDSHQPTFTLLQQLIEELVPDADVSIKWGTIAYDLDGSLFALSANKKHVNLYILTVGLLAEYADDLAGIPQSKCVLRFSPSAEVPLETLRKVMTDAVERKRAG